MKISRIFLDMDDVLVDFDRAVCDLYGVLYEETMAKRTDWDIVLVLNTTQEEFQGRVGDAGVVWWESLPELPWCDEVIEICNEFAERVTIVSAPMSKHAKVGKGIWLKNKFGTDYEDYELRHDKEELAAPGTLLVDDRPRNCGKFSLAGGKAFMFPAHSNPLSKYRGDMKYVRHMIGKCVEEILIEEKVRMW